MDAFYASVELRDRPELRGRPVAVGGSAQKRGVIAAASYASREFGVRSAMPTAQALRLCPELVLLPADFDKYTSVSQEIMAIFQRYTPLVEPLSLDEAFLDVEGCERLLGDAEAIGRALKADVLRETGLVCSVGIAPSKFLAKLASELSKPDGFKVIRPEEIRSVLDPLPVSRIFGVGERTAKRLEALGVTTVSQLASRPRAEVMREFGASGAWIHDLAHGIDPRRVNPRREEKSHGLERTFERDINDRDELRLALYEFCEEVSHELRHRGLRGRTITLKARYWNFKTVTRSKTVELPVNLGKRIYAVARELFDKLPPGPLRLLGVQLSNLTDVRAPAQASLFSGLEPGAGPGEAPSEVSEQKLERTTRALDDLRARFGAGTVVPANLLSRASLRVREREGEKKPERPRR